MAFAIMLYNRNKVQNAGESFLINEEGNLIEYEKSKDKDESNIDEFAVLFDDSEDEKQINGMSKKDYKWLIGR